MNRPRPALWKRLLRFAAFALIALVTLAALALSWFSFQGRREWARTKADLLARGEKLSLVELAPPSVPDAQNFYGVPLWLELADTVETISPTGIPISEPRQPKGQRQIDAIAPPIPALLRERAQNLLSRSELPFGKSTQTVPFARAAYRVFLKTSDEAQRRALAQFIVDTLDSGTPIRRHLEELLVRPYAVFPSNYSRGFTGVGLNHLNYLIIIAQTCDFLAHAQLALGNSASAAREVILCLRLSTRVGSHEVLMGALVRNSLSSLPVSAIADGIHRHAWSNEELDAFKTVLHGMEVRKEFADALRGERGAFNQALESMQRGRPEGKDAMGL